MEVLVQAEVIAGGWKALEQPPLGVLTLREGQERSRDGLLRAGQAEITPFRSEDGILPHGHSFGLRRLKIFYVHYEID